MKLQYFLGANSKDGFYSLYEGFPSEKDAFLHIIKSGPGTGKSSFMRRIGEAAESKNYNVHYILCSGDPDSLDGIYIPEIKQAWVDGTSPHALEPEVFGVTSDYVNLSDFFSGNLNEDEQKDIARLRQEYKASYSRAYSCISAVPPLRRAYLPNLFKGETEDTLRRRMDSILRHHLIPTGSKEGIISRRFLSAISCKGRLRLSEEIPKLCSLVYQIEDGFGGADFCLEYAAGIGREQNEDMILCPSPLNPEKAEAILFPAQSLALLKGDWGIASARNVRIDSFIPNFIQHQHKSDIHHEQKLENGIMQFACENLRRGKELHDAMEEIYKRHMDFKKLDRFTQKQIEKYIL